MKRKKTADKRRQEIITEKRKAARIQTRPEIEMLAVDRLVPYAKNSKKHDDRQVAAIAGSIREFGFTNPVLIDGQDGIIAGHGRVLGARNAGLAEVPCIRLAHLTDAQRRAYILADNRLAETGGGWDAAMLAAEVEAIDWEELESFGLDDMDLGEILAEAERGAEGDADAEAQIDRAEELNQTWGVKPGDLWLIGSHRLVCGDSTKAEDVGLVMGEDKATFVFTDPPYGVSYSGRGKSTSQQIIENDDLNLDDLRNFLAAALSAMPLADGCNVFVCHADQKPGIRPVFEDAFLAAGLHMGGTCIWVKNVASMGWQDFRAAHEPILFGWSKGGERMRVTDRAITTVWKVGREGNYLHPTTKPVELVSYAIRACAPSDAICYDPFLGSGTTMVAAQNLGRKCYGLEISPAYCSVILQRMKDAFPGIEIRKADA